MKNDSFSHYYLRALCPDNYKMEYFWLNNDMDTKDKRKHEWALEREVFGFDSRSLWNLDHVMSSLLYERLKMYAMSPHLRRFNEGQNAHHFVFKKASHFKIQKKQHLQQMSV